MMKHKGVEYMVAPTATPGIWRWQFQIGDLVKTGRTETRINLLAMRRVQLRIDRELKKANAQSAPPHRGRGSCRSCRVSPHEPARAATQFRHVIQDR